MKEIFERLKSPVVLIEIVTIVSNLIVVLHPAIETEAKAVVTALTAIIAVFAGLNNPTDRKSF